MYDPLRLYPFPKQDDFVVLKNPNSVRKPVDVTPAYIFTGKHGFCGTTFHNMIFWDFSLFLWVVGSPLVLGASGRGFEPVFRADCFLFLFLACGGLFFVIQATTLSH